MSDLQFLITGGLVAALRAQRDFLVDVAMAVDGEGNYEPWFFVTGRNSGTKLKVSVEVVDE